MASPGAGGASGRQSIGLRGTGVRGTRFAGRDLSPVPSSCGWRRLCGPKADRSNNILAAKQVSFQHRLLLVITIASSLGATLTCGGFVVYQRAQLRENLHQELDTLARMLA